MTLSGGSDTFPPITERTTGEKHAYLDGFRAGLQRALDNPDAVRFWLENVELIRANLPPRT